MDQHSRYKTKQKEILLGYLSSTSGEHITAGDVCRHFQEQGANIGQATVYRQLEHLVDEGILNKYFIDGMSPACFEYIEKEDHVEHDTYFHFKCEKCGKLIHLHCDELNGVQAHLYAEHGLRMNPYRTVFYGLCGSCT